MAGVEEAIIALFKNETTLTDVLGTPIRLTPDVIPQGATLPAVAYQRVATERTDTLANISNLIMPTIQLTIWAASAVSRQAVKDAVRHFVRQLNADFKSGARSRYVSGVRIGFIAINAEFDQHEPASTVYQSVVDLQIWANEG